MKKLLGLTIGLLFCLPAWAKVDLEPLLNKVTLQLQTEQWVTTKSALVDVSVNAAVTDQGIEKIQANVLQKLSKLSNKGEWHVLSFNRQLDKTGLESVQIMAQARLPQDDLGNLRSQAKSISKPGETYTVDNVQFTPSEEEVRQVNIAMRNALYMQAKAEIDTLNKIYTDQKYYLHDMNFVSQSPIMPMPMPMNAMAMEKGMTRAAASPLAIGNKAQLYAMVVVASTPANLPQ